MTPQEIKQDKISNARSHHRNSYADILEHLPDSLFTDINFVLDDSCIPYLDDEGKKLYAERKKDKLIKTSKNRFCEEYIKLLEILPASVFLNSFSLTEDCLQYLDEEGKKLFFAYKEKKKSNQAKQCLKNIHNNPNFKFQKKYSVKELYLLNKRRRISHYYNEFSQLSELLKKLPLSSYDGDFELSPSLRDYFDDEETKSLFDKTIQEYFEQRKRDEKRGRKKLCLTEEEIKTKELQWKKNKIIRSYKSRGYSEHVEILSVLPLSAFDGNFQFSIELKKYIDTDELKSKFDKCLMQTLSNNKKRMSKAIEKRLEIINNKSKLTEEEIKTKELQWKKNRIIRSYKNRGYSEHVEILSVLPLSAFDGEFQFSIKLKKYIETDDLKLKFDKCLMQTLSNNKKRTSKAIEKRLEIINNNKNASGFTKTGNTTSVIIRKKNGLPKQQKKEETTETQMLLPPSKTKKVKKSQNENIGRIECPVCERLLPHNEFKSPYRFACVRCEQINSKLRPELNNYAELSIDAREASERGDNTAYISLRNKLSVAYYKLKSKCKTF